MTSVATAFTVDIKGVCCFHHFTRRPEDGSSKFLCYVGKLLQENTALLIQFLYLDCVVFFLLAS